MLLTSLPRPHPLLLLGGTVVLALAYFYTLATRPDFPDWKRREDRKSRSVHLRSQSASRYGYPTWFAAPSNSQPPDISPAARLRSNFEEILFFIDLPKSSPFLSSAFHLTDTLSTRTDVNISVITPWSRQWNVSLTAAENLEAAGCKRRLWIIGEESRDLEGACRSSTIVNLHVGSDVVVNPRSNITLLLNPSHLLSKGNAYDSMAESFGADWEMGLIGHILPFTDPGLFFPKAQRGRYHRAVTYVPADTTVPTDWPTLPPGRRYTVYKRKYTSQKVSDRPAGPLKPPSSVEDRPHLPGSKLRKWLRKRDRAKAAVMSRSGVCISENWQSGHLDLDVAKAMLSGCLVASVTPSVEPATIGKVILPLRSTEEQLPFDDVELQLGSLTDSELKRKVLDAFLYARHHFTGQACVDSILDIADHWDRGGRGYMFPTTFRQQGE